jgi:uroporphyrin-III C-methyltransferase
LKKLLQLALFFRAEGKGNLPVAVIENGSSSSENVVVGIVDTIEELIIEKKLTSPALLVFGNVVSLHPQFNAITAFYAIMAQEEY